MWGAVSSAQHGDLERIRAGKSRGEQLIKADAAKDIVCWIMNSIRSRNTSAIKGVRDEGQEGAVGHCHWTKWPQWPSKAGAAHKKTPTRDYFSRTRQRSCCLVVPPGEEGLPVVSVLRGMWESLRVDLGDPQSKRNMEFSRQAHAQQRCPQVHVHSLPSAAIYW